MIALLDVQREEDGIRWILGVPSSQLIGDIVISSAEVLLLQRVPGNVVTFLVEVTKHLESIAVRSSYLGDVYCVRLQCIFLQSLIARS